VVIIIIIVVTLPESTRVLLRQFR